MLKCSARVLKKSSRGPRERAVAISVDARLPRRVPPRNDCSSFFSNLLHLRDVRHCLFALVGGVGVVLELAGEESLVGGQVEKTVTAEVEEDDALLAGLAGGEGLVDGAADGVGGLRGGDDAFGSGELDGGLGGGVLVEGAGLHVTVGAGLGEVG